jgi:hypothetical protein
MTDEPSASDPTASGDAASCPIPADSLPPQFRKHVDPSTAQKLRMMAAKALIPMPPAEQVKALFILTFDPEEEVRATACAAAAGLPDRILNPVLRGDVHPAVLDFLSRQLHDKDQYIELILLNQQTSDETFAYLSRRVSDRLLTIVADNQLRMLRHDDIIRGIHENPNASAALLDKVDDFAVRSGVNLPDLPSFQEARRRILGEAADAAPAEEETAEGLLEAHRDDLAAEKDSEEELEEATRETLTQKILKMTVSEKIKLASLGNKEARTLLLRDANKLVQAAAVQSPRITEGEIVGLTNSRTVPDEVMRIILNNRDWMKNYQVKVNLVNNPKTPLPTALRLLPHLRGSELRSLARNRNVPNALSTQARNLMEKKSSGKGA